jgi:heme/copper-type cytochrome/quinol oxidase subunit 4
MSSTQQHSRGLGTDIVIYLCLLGIAGLQIVLAYSGSPGRGLVGRLLVVAAVQAGIAVLFFMHLRAERRSLLVFVAVFTFFVLSCMQFSWSDSFRLIHGVPYAHMQ